MKRRRSHTTSDHIRPELVPTTQVLGNPARRCQRWHHSTGRQCRKAALKGHDFCRTCSGNRSFGPANSNWKHGKWSSLLPQALRPSSRPALHHRDAIEITDGRIEALCREIGAGATGIDGELRATYDDLTGAMHAADSDGIRAALLRMRDQIDGVTAQEKSFRELDRLLKRRSELVDAERRFMLDARNAMSREEASAHANALVSAIVRHVHDRKTLNAILNDVRAVIDVSTSDA